MAAWVHLIHLTDLGRRANRVHTWTTDFWHRVCIIAWSWISVGIGGCRMLSWCHSLIIVGRRWTVVWRGVLIHISRRIDSWMIWRTSAHVLSADGTILTRGLIVSLEVIWSLAWSWISRCCSGLCIYIGSRLLVMVAIWTCRSHSARVPGRLKWTATKRNLWCKATSIRDILIISCSSLNINWCRCIHWLRC